MRWGMLEYIIGYSLSIVIIAIISLYGSKALKRTHKIESSIRLEGDLVKENLNHIAGAIVGLSELLEEAEEMVQDASRIPTMGEMMQQMLTSFIMQKMQPKIQNMQTPNIITDVTNSVESWRNQDAENQPLDAPEAEG